MDFVLIRRWRKSSNNLSPFASRDAREKLYLERVNVNFMLDSIL